MARARGSLAVAVLVATGASGAGRAHASPYDDPGAGRAVFTGPVSPDPTSIVGNAAALELGTEGNHVWVGGTAAVDQYSIALDREDATGVRTAGATVGATTHSWGGQLAAYTVHPAFALGGMIDLPPAELHPDGQDALRYHTLGGGQREKTYAAIGGALRLADGLYVGGSATYTETSIDLAFARDTALEGGTAGVQSACGGAPCGVGNPQADEIYRIHTSTGLTSPQTKIAFTMGLAWQVTSRVTLGAMYKEPQGFNAAVLTQGTVSVTPAPRVGGAAVYGLATIAFVPPQVLELGARVHVWPTVDAIAGGRWEHTSRTAIYDLRMFGRELAGIPEVYPRARGLRDDVEGWAGLEEVDDGQALVLGGRLGFESGATAAERISPMQVEGWSLTADVGASVRVRTHWVLVAGYGAQLYLPQDVAPGAYDPRARIACVDSNYDYASDACETVRGGYGTDTAAGHYLRIGHVFHLGLRYDGL